MYDNNHLCRKSNLFALQIICLSIQRFKHPKSQQPNRPTPVQSTLPHFTATFHWQCSISTPKTENLDIRVSIVTRLLWDVPNTLSVYKHVAPSCQLIAGAHLFVDVASLSDEGQEFPQKFTVGVWTCRITTEGVSGQFRSEERCLENCIQWQVLSED